MGAIRGSHWRQMHDLVIDNAVVLDGLGGPARAGGVAVAGGRIAAVGHDLGPARQRVDARGLALAPGIVDIHTHYDAQLTWDPFATPSTLEQHNGENGIPMPSRLADEAELLALTGALGEAGRGVFMLTKGMTSSIPWLEKVAAASGRPVMIAAMFVDPGDPARVFRELGEIESARQRGRELWAQVGCFPLGMEFTLRHPYPLEAFLAWRPAILAGDDEAAYRRVLADPSFRKRLKEEAATPGVPNRFSDKTFPHLAIAEVQRAEHTALVGRTIGELAG